VLDLKSLGIAEVVKTGCLTILISSRTLAAAPMTPYQYSNAGGAQTGVGITNPITANSFYYVPWQKKGFSPSRASSASFS